MSSKISKIILQILKAYLKNMAPEIFSYYS